MSQVPIVRVQGPARATSTGSSITVQLARTPSSGNVLVAVISSSKVATSGYTTVSGISHTGVNWSGPQVYSQYSDGASDALNIEIWAGVVGTGAANFFTVNITSAANEGAICNVCEYSGIST
jgi:hypothetical protein